MKPKIYFEEVFSGVTFQFCLFSSCSFLFKTSTVELQLNINNLSLS